MVNHNNFFFKPTWEGREHITFSFKKTPISRIQSGNTCHQPDYTFYPQLSQNVRIEI